MEWKVTFHLYNPLIRITEGYVTFPLLLYNPPAYRRTSYILPLTATPAWLWRTCYISPPASTPLWLQKDFLQPHIMWSTLSYFTLLNSCCCCPKGSLEFWVHSTPTKSSKIPIFPCNFFASVYYIKVFRYSSNFIFSRETPQPFRIAPIDHWAYRPSSLLTIKPIDHWDYRPSSLLNSCLLSRLLSLLACYILYAFP